MSRAELSQALAALDPAGTGRITRSSFGLSVQRFFGDYTTQMMETFIDMMFPEMVDYTAFIDVIYPEEVVSASRGKQQPEAEAAPPPTTRRTSRRDRGWRSSADEAAAAAAASAVPAASAGMKLHSEVRKLLKTLKLEDAIADKLPKELLRKCDPDEPLSEFLQLKEAEVKRIVEAASAGLASKINKAIAEGCSAKAALVQSQVANQVASVLRRAGAKDIEAADGENKNKMLLHVAKDYARSAVLDVLSKHSNGR